jgi:hypothetical protein
MFEHFNPIAWFAVALGVVAGVAASPWLLPNVIAPVVHFYVNLIP